MDDEFTLWAVPIEPVDAPPNPDADLPTTLPFAPPSPAARPPLPPDEGFLLRGYDSPGEYFQPRLRKSGAA